MNIEVVKISLEQKQILRNLLKMYCYEWSQYNKFDVNDQGDYKFEYNISHFWEKKNHYLFFIKVDGVLAGFVLIDDDFALYKDSDYAISEFFVMHKYRRAGVGQYAVNIVFDMFHGKWEIALHPHNITSVKFWNSVIRKYTNDKYETIKSCKDLVYNDGTFGDIISFKS